MKSLIIALFVACSFAVVAPQAEARPRLARKAVACVGKGCKVAAKAAALPVKAVAKGAKAAAGAAKEVGEKIVRRERRCNRRGGCSAGACSGGSCR